MTKIVQVWNVSALLLHHLFLTRILFSRTRPQPCDRKVDLYILEPKALVLKDSTRSARVLANKNCSRYVHFMFRLVQVKSIWKFKVFFFSSTSRYSSFFLLTFCWTNNFQQQSFVYIKKIVHTYFGISLSRF